MVETFGANLPDVSGGIMDAPVLPWSASSPLPRLAPRRNRFAARCAAVARLAIRFISRRSSGRTARALIRIVTGRLPVTRIDVKSVWLCQVRA